MTTYNSQFDHFLHRVADFDQGMVAYTNAGMPTHPVLTDESFKNGVWQIDVRYIELLWLPGAINPDHVFADSLRYLQRAFERHPTGGLTFAVNVDDALAVADDLERQGRKVGRFQPKFDHTDVCFDEIFLLDAPTWMPFFITYHPHRDELQKLLAAQRPPLPSDLDLVSLVVETADPAVAAQQLADLVQVPLADGRLPLPGCAVEFREGPAEAIVAVQLAGDRPASAQREGSSELLIDGLTYHFSGQ